MKISQKVIIILLTAFTVSSFAAFSNISAEASDTKLNETRERVRAQYGENKRITDSNYDKSLAVRCVNGTFIGKKNDGVIAYKGIPFVGKQPVGELRWKEIGRAHV